MRGVPRDRAPLRDVEVFLLHLLDQEEGERPGDLGADEMRGHPPLGAAGSRVHALPALQIQQGVALALVLPEERPCRSLAGLLRASDQRGTAVMAVGATRHSLKAICLPLQTVS